MTDKERFDQQEWAHTRRPVYSKSWGHKQLQRLDGRIIAIDPKSGQITRPNRDRRTKKERARDKRRAKMIDSPEAVAK
jgi:hypothetical protein